MTDRPGMTDEQRAAFIDAAMAAWRLETDTDRAFIAVELDALVRAGFTITLDAVRDHTDCETCDGAGVVCSWCGGSYARSWCGDATSKPVPCPGGRPVVWEPT